MFDRRSAALAALPSRGAIAALWPTRHRLVTFGFDAAGNEELRAVLATTGRITRRVRLAERLDAEVSGRRVRVLQRTRSGLALDVFSADGRRLRRYRFDLPAGVTPSLMGGSLRDGMVLVSTTTGAVAPYRHALVPLGGSEHPIDLTGAVYRFVTPGIVADAEGNLASLDRRTLTVSREVTDAPGGWLTPVAGRRRARPGQPSVRPRARARRREPVRAGRGVGTGRERRSPDGAHAALPRRRPRRRRDRRRCADGSVIARRKVPLRYREARVCPAGPWRGPTRRLRLRRSPPPARMPNGEQHRQRRQRQVPEREAGDRHPAARSACPPSAGSGAAPRGR